MKRTIWILSVIILFSAGAVYADWWESLERSSSTPEPVVERGNFGQKTKVDDKTLKDATVSKEDITASTASAQENSAVAATPSDPVSGVSAPEPPQVINDNQDANPGIGGSDTEKGDKKVPAGGGE